jgi:HPt (histidine-containing phosphotransfer) domain-containing protein
MTDRHIDLSYLERLYKGDRARIRQWIQLYLEEAPGMFNRLSDGQEKGDSEELVAAAHDLRPYAHYLGAPHLLNRLITIGQLARSVGPTSTSELVREVMALGGHIETVMRALITKGGPASEPV